MKIRLTPLLLLAVFLCPRLPGVSTAFASKERPVIGLSLDTLKGERWQKDRDSFIAKVESLGGRVIVQSANGDDSRQTRDIGALITRGVDVLVVVAHNGSALTRAIKEANESKIPVIAYDRLIMNSDIALYLTFDNVKVGSLMGEGLQACLDANGKTKANIIYINGDPNDNNAALFKSGYEQALKPKIDSGDYTLVGDQSGFWDATKAGDAYEQLYTQNQGKIDGVVSANDTMAGGIIARMKANGTAGQVPITGQDASTEGLQNILQGYQCGTVYKNTDLEAKAASDLAIALIKGEDTSSMVTGSVKDTESGKDVPSALATPVWITMDNIKQPFDDGFAKASDVCTGKIADLCTKAGIS